MAGIYIHVPFCRKRCVYCDFFSTTQEERKAEYVDALCRELAERKDYIGGETVETVYLGGGTPSQLSETELGKIFDTLYRIYPVSRDAEITLEANPDDLHPDYIRMLRTLPFNRISIGMQTFQDDILTLLGRRHTAKQAAEAFHDCREAGFANISIDLMYGLPGETEKTWEADLGQALAMRPEHISAYHLIYEEGTELWRLREAHRVEEVDEDLSVSLFTRLIHTLGQHGYVHYEISNFCLPGRHSRHNSSYWTGKRYLGCGPSAHSYDGKSRQWNIASLDGYVKGINGGKRIYEKEELDLYTRYNDFVLTSVRTCWGLPLGRLKTDFGEMLYGYCLKMARPHIGQGMLEIREGVLKLTEKGIFISDGIMSDLMWV